MLSIVTSQEVNAMPEEGEDQNRAKSSSPHPALRREEKPGKLAPTMLVGAPQGPESNTAHVSVGKSAKNEKHTIESVKSTC